ncbi:MAG: hypothetical protein KIT19_09820 [Phycisphaeraceae bacterium]|nr:hypothetical protein [Phycisphaeraceae bacterium]
MKKTLAVLAASGMALAASADVLVVDITGWRTFAGYGNVNNSSITIPLPAGSTIDSASYEINFDAINGSWRSELVLSLNDGLVGAFFDHAPSTLGSGGNFVGSGNFGSLPGAWAGGPFVLTTGSLFVTAFETFDDGGASVQDARINSGRIVINYTPIPAPGSLALLGLAGLAARRRR